MQTVKLILLLIVCLALVLLVVQNTAPVEAQFLWFSAEIPGIVLLFLTAVGGFVLGLLAAALFLGRSRAKGRDATGTRR